MGWRSARGEQAGRGRRLRVAFSALTLVVGLAGLAAADHGVGLRSPGLGPMAAAVIFGGLTLLLGLVVALVVTVLTRRSDRTDPSSAGDE